MRNCLKRSFFTVLLLGAAMLLSPLQGTAAALQTVQNPQNGSIGVQGEIASPPPKNAPTIATPSSGQTFTSIPVTVSGLCTSGLLVKVFSNNVFIGSTICVNGSYAVQVDLLPGTNDLVARVFDALGQSGPDSNVVSVTFNSAQFNPFGAPLLTITSDYAERGANPGDTLTWPVVLSGGTSPYAISVDWGDGTPASLISTAFTGDITLSHVYSKAGTYTVSIKATDKDGMEAFLQVVAVANGAITSAAGSSSPSICASITHVLWLPALISIPLIIIAFWLGRRYELAVLRKHLEENADSSDEE